MKYIKKFELFREGATETSPERTTTKPTTKPGKPDVRPSRPGAIPSKDPNSVPSPAKAEKKKKTATAEEVAERFINLMVDKHEDVKKYTEL